MAIHRMQLDDFETVDYQLIAIHSLLEDYRLAYFLNETLPIFLEKSSQKIIVKSKIGVANYTRFAFENYENDMIWHLVQNKNEIFSTTYNKVQNLFFEEKMETETKVFLLPEFKVMDYILKIDNPSYDFDMENIIVIINAIDEISTAYEIDINLIKSKNNLIF